MDTTDAVAAGGQRVVGLSDLVRVPMRRWRVVLVGVVVVTLAVLGYLTLTSAKYTATSVVVVRAVVTDPFTYPAGGADRAVNMTAESGVATSNDVIDKTASITGRTPDEVRKALTIEVPVGGQVLRFDFLGRSEREAVAGANAAATTYLEVRQGLYEDQRAALLKSYDETIASVTDQRKTAQHGLPVTLNQNTTSPSTQAVLDQVRALNDQLAQLAEQRAKIASADLSPGVMTSAARAPIPSSHDGAALYLLGAVLGGVILGGVLAFVRESLDRRVRSLADAAEITGLPVLGTVRAPRWRARTAAAADTRYVALAVADATERQPLRRVVVLSSRDDEGRTDVAAGLAVALAEGGHEVYLGGPAHRRQDLRALLLAAQRSAASRALVDPRAAAPPSRRPPTLVHVNGSTAAGPDGDHDTGEILKFFDDAPYPARLGDADTLPGKNNRIAATLVERERVASSVAADQLPPADEIDAVGGSTGQPADGPTGAAADGPTGAAAERSSADPAADPGGGDVVAIGAGSVRLGGMAERTDRPTVVLDAPAAERDPSGVRAAHGGVAVLIAARDRTRCADLARLAARVQAAGVPAIGFVLTGDGRG